MDETPATRRRAIATRVLFYGALVVILPIVIAFGFGLVNGVLTEMFYMNEP